MKLNKLFETSEEVNLELFFFYKTDYMVFTVLDLKFPIGNYIGGFKLQFLLHCQGGQGISKIANGRQMPKASKCAKIKALKSFQWPQNWSNGPHNSWLVE